jgi:hypothetical protein
MALFSKRRRRRIIIRFRRFFKGLGLKIAPNENDVLDDIQKQVVSNVRRMMSKEDSVLLLAPISNICYIEWKHYFIRFGDSAVTITNGKFSYYVWLPSKTTDNLKSMFYKNVEARRMKLESVYDRKTLDNLKIISTDLSK